MAETVRKNLGMVTAYAYAVSKGYSGTEEEFAELMASYADVAHDAEVSAQAAAQSATTAEQKANQAAGSATSASESAQAAAGSSNSANLYAQNASASATQAAGSASSASTHAGNASASAQAAEGSANDAQASATQAAGSADDAEAAKDLILGMNAVAETLPAGSQATASYSNGTLTLGIPKGDTGEKGDPGDTNDAPLIYSSASGSVANFTDGADNLPMKSAVVTIEPIQAGSGDSSPDNVRPISGRTGLSVVRSGKNLLDKASYKFLSNSNIVWGATTNNTWADGSLMLEAGTYTFLCSAEVNGIYIANQIQNIFTRYGASFIAFTLPQKTPIKIMVYKSGSSSSELLGMDYQLEIGSTATDYEPYKGSTYSVNWETEAGTVYGGTLDVVSGKLIVTHFFKEYIAGDFGKGSMSQADEFYAKSTGTDVAVADTAYSSKIIRCNYAKNVSSLVYDSVITRLSSRLPRIIFPLSYGLSSVALFDEWLSNQVSPIQFLMKLNEPIEIQLTPQEIRTLLGENNIWSDGGDISIEYPSDTKMYIDNKIAEAIAAAMA